jgi:hypothetical protein
MVLLVLQLPGMVQLVLLLPVRTVLLVLQLPGMVLLPRDILQLVRVPMVLLLAGTVQLVQLLQQLGMRMVLSAGLPMAALQHTRIMGTLLVGSVRRVWE